MVDFSTLFIFKGLPSQATNAITDSFYGTEFGLPLFPLLLTRSDRLAPYCFSTFLAGTPNYLAGTHNYFFTFLTSKTTVHRGLPQGGWYCTISFFWGLANPAGSVLVAARPPRFLFGRAWQPSRFLCRNFLMWSLLCLIFAFAFCLDECAMGFPDSSCLFCDLIPFVYLLS